MQKWLLSHSHFLFICDPWLSLVCIENNYIFSNGFRGQCLLHVFYEPYSSEKPGVLQSVGPRRHDLATEQNNNIVQYAITSFVSHKNHSKFTTILHRNRRKTILNISSPRQQKIWFNFKLHLYLSKGCHFHIRLLT